MCSSCPAIWRSRRRIRASSCGEGHRPARGRGSSRCGRETCWPGSTTPSLRASSPSRGRPSRKPQARLAELEAGSRPQEIEQAKANVQSEEAELVRIRKDYERSEMLYRNGAISTAQFDAAKSAYESRAAQLRHSSESLSLIKEGPRKESIEAAAYRVRQARAQLKVDGGEAGRYTHLRAVFRRHPEKERRARRNRGTGHPRLYHRRSGAIPG